MTTVSRDLPPILVSPNSTFYLRPLSPKLILSRDTLHWRLRNTFGTQRRGGPWANFGDLTQKSVANTNVIMWGGRCLALWEASPPYALEPTTLETLGVDLLGGLLRPGLPFSTGKPAVDRGESVPVGFRLMFFCGPGDRFLIVDPP